jgi:hypothetical protein
MADLFNDIASGALNASDSLLGPHADYDSLIPTPVELGVSTDGSIDQMVTNQAAIAYYFDTLLLGKRSPMTNMFGGKNQVPVGNRYFLPSGSKCTNGEDLYMYVDNIPRGNLLGSKMAQLQKDMGIPKFQGLGPGVIEDAVALNPIPIFYAVMGAANECKKVTYPVTHQQNSDKKWVEIDKPATNGDIEFDSKTGKVLDQQPACKTGAKCETRWISTGFSLKSMTGEGFEDQSTPPAPPPSSPPPTPPSTPPPAPPSPPPLSHPPRMHFPVHHRPHYIDYPRSIYYRDYPSYYLSEAPVRERVTIVEKEDNRLRNLVAVFLAGGIAGYFLWKNSK